MTQTTPGLFECFIADIAAIVGAFSERDPAGKLSLQQLLQSAPGTFQQAAISFIRNAPPTSGCRYLVQLLIKERLLAPALADPSACSPQDALAAAMAIRKLGASIEDELVRLLGAALRRDGSAPVLLRIMDLLKALDAEKDAQIYELDLTRHPDPRVRSKAALIIAQASKSATRVSRALLEGDPRVQANAVEGLWNLGANEYRAIFRMACLSPHNRVAGNGAVGLYRSGDVEAITRILELAERPDRAFQLTGVWAMGETGDPRFLPYLTHLYETTSDAKVKVSAVRSMARIRRVERTLRAAGEITITQLRAPVTEERRTRLRFSLRSPAAADLSGLEPLRFVLSHDGVLVTEYTVESLPNPPVLLTGFVLPMATATPDPYREAIASGLSSCLSQKRSGDLWRVEHFLGSSAAPGEPDPNAPAASSGGAGGGARLRQRHGFISEPELIQKVCQGALGKDRAAKTSVEAAVRVAEAMKHVSGKRNLFLFADPDLPQGIEVEKLAGLKAMAAAEQISLHGFAPDTAPMCEALQELCLGSDNGSFETASTEALPQAIVHAYQALFNRYELVFSQPPGAGDSAVDLKIYSTCGCGEAKF